MSCLLGLIRRLVWQPVGRLVEFSLDIQCGRASCELSEKTKNRWHIVFANHVGVDLVNHEGVDPGRFLYRGNDYHRVHWFFGIAPSERIILNVVVVTIGCQFSLDSFICVLWSTVFFRRHLLEGRVPAAFC